jgi:hypothetical protein
LQYRGAIPVRAQQSAPTISTVKVVQTGATSTVITWKTDRKTDAVVNYGLNANYGVARDTAQGTDHSLLLNGLEPATTYYFRVISVDSSGNQGISENYTFNTKPPEGIVGTERVASPQERTLTEKALTILNKIKDPAALELLSERIEQIAESSLSAPRILGNPDLEIGTEQVTITWETDKESGSVVEFSSDDEYDPVAPESYTRKEGDSGEQVVKHSVTLYGLQPATLYHFRIISKSALGPSAQSSDKTFTTNSVLPEIVSVRIEKVEEHAATISISASYPVSAMVEYTNVSTREKQSQGNPSLLANHTVRLENLEFKTAYSAVVKVRNEEGDEAESSPITFVTSKDEAPPVISRVNNESTLYPDADAKIQTIVSWETDEPAVCKLWYAAGLAGDGNENRSLPEEANALEDHVQVITEFTPATTYKFWVECRDGNNNSSKSEDFVIFTPQKEKNIVDIILENFQSTFGWLKKVGK